MARIHKLGAWALGGAMAASLTACVSNPNYGNPGYGGAGPVYPQQPAGVQQPAYAQYGSVMGVDLVRAQGGVAGQGVVGTVAGGVVGGALGNQVGKGSGRRAATVAGAIGGALIGRAIEQSMGGTGYGHDVYRVTVRLDDGYTRTFDYAEVPNVRVGDRVRVDGNQLYR